MRKDYIVFILLLAFTTFEFFFRAEMLSVLLYLIAGVVILINQRVYSTKIFNRTITIYLTIFISCYLVQTIFLDNYYFSSFISRSVGLIGPLLVATIVEKRAISIYVRVLYWISIISLVIYFICFIPGIHNFLFNSIAPHFISLNANSAVIEGGGVNIIIYNFLSDYTLEGLGIPRNSGPFWEPGQFGVYICIALFFNLFVEKQTKPFINFVFILSLLTTCSTGAYMAGFSIFALYTILKSKNILYTIVYLVLIVLVWQLVSDLEFVSEKILSHLENAEVGSDQSRFGAFLTQVDMICNSPILGGEEISDYIHDDRRTLASGTLLPFVVFGIPYGILFFAYMCKSCLSITKNLKHNITIGISFFILLLILSFSQTILMTPVIITLIYVGLIKIAK